MSGYAEFARLTATPLDRAVDKAIQEYNDAYLADEEAQRRDREIGKLWARAMEAQRRGFVQKPYPEETLEQFAERAGC